MKTPVKTTCAIAGVSFLSGAFYAAVSFKGLEKPPTKPPILKPDLDIPMEIVKEEPDKCEWLGVCDDNA